MKLCVIGTGYVGLVVGACLAGTGNDVTCADIDQRKIDDLNRGKLPIYEPGLLPIVQQNVAERRLEFTTDVAAAVCKAEIIFIAVGTPPDEDGSADLSHVCDVAETIGDNMNGFKVVVTKSTVPVGTCDKVRAIIGPRTDQPFAVVSNPEFLKEGAAVSDFLKPDRIIIGCDDERARALMSELYAPFVRTENPVIYMDIRSAEMTKYASNAMLATRISFMNEIARLCEKAGADVGHVRRGMGSDPRIGRSFLFPGAGYGGSCFPKDVKAIIRTGSDHGVEMEILNSVEDVNAKQKRRVAERVIDHYGEDLSDRLFAVWGLSFKPQTDDMREASSIVIIEMLLERGARIRAYDPVAHETAAQVFGDRIELCGHTYDPLEGADALIIITEWNQFRTPDFDRIKGLLKAPVVVDGRNLYKVDHMEERGFTYYSIGRRDGGG